MGAHNQKVIRTCEACGRTYRMDARELITHARTCRIEKAQPSFLSKVFQKIVKR